MSLVDKEGYIYAMVSGNHIKLGRSRDPERRLQQLKTARPDIQLKYTLFVKDMIKAENSIHAIFAYCKLEQEWFNISKETDLALLRRIFKIDKITEVEERTLRSLGLR